MNFQDMIFALKNFWSSQGCIIYEPYDVEKGAGTMNPATFLRTLGPEPWHVATSNRLVARLTAAMATIRTASISTISSRLSANRRRTTFRNSI